MRRRRFPRPAALILPLALAGLACNDASGTDPEHVPVVGTVRDAQSNTRLFFYNEDLEQLAFSVAVRQDGSFGPLLFDEGTFFGAGTGSGATTGEFLSFEVRGSEDSVVVELDLDPITIPLAVGNRWTYDEEVFAPVAGEFTVTVEITAQQPGQGVPAVFTVEERRVAGGTGGGVETVTYFLAQEAQGIRKSADAAVDANDELLLRLPATLGTSWSTVDFATGAALQKRLTGFICDESGCRETSDFTIAVEPAGIFMSVSERHQAGATAVVTVFSDIGIVDSFVQSTGTGAAILSQRKLRSFQPGSGT